MSRRRFLAGAAASGAVLLGRPAGALASALGPSGSPGAARASRLFPGSWLVHADLHNHTLFSDGDGEPADAFASMRDSGLDVAALTDHSVLGGPLGAGLSACGADCTSVRGIDETSWAEIAALADGADDPGTFCAIRGFEWSSPTLGHVNVWHSQEWIDPERTAGLAGIEGLPGFLDELPEAGPPPGEPLESLVGDVAPGSGSMALFYDWLMRHPGSPLLGGGADGLAGFNHPGREPGRFSQFGFDARLVDRIVSLELFNRTEDYLFEGTDAARPSPLSQCLDQGWRVGLLGVTDEHGTDWGTPEGKGRGGLWVTELSRQGVRDAMIARSVFATRERGMRFDAALAGVRMGGTVGHRTGPLELLVDIAGPDWAGRTLTLQVLRPGLPMPDVALEVDIVVPAPDGALPRVAIPLDVEDGRWVVVRLLDPDGDADGRAVGAFSNGRALAYSSPWWLDPARVTRPIAATGPPTGAPSPVPGSVGGPAPLPATGGATAARAVGAGLALGASLAAGAVHRHVTGPGGEHTHPHDHSHAH